MEIRSIGIVSELAVIGEFIEFILVHQRPVFDPLPGDRGRQEDSPVLLSIGDKIVQHIGAEVPIRTVGENDKPGIVRRDGFVDQTLRHEETIMPYEHDSDGFFICKLEKRG